MKGGVKNHGIFSMSNAKMRGKGNKLEYRRFSLNTGKHFGALKMMEHWHRLPKKVKESPPQRSSEVTWTWP